MNFYETLKESNYYIWAILVSVGRGLNRMSALCLAVLLLLLLLYTNHIKENRPSHRTTRV